MIIIQYTRILRSMLSALGKISFHFHCLAGLVRKSSAGKTHRHLSVVVLLLHNVSLTRQQPKHPNYSYNQSPMRLPASPPCMARRPSKRIACAFLNSLRTPCRRVHSRSTGSHPRAFLTLIPANTRSRRQRRSTFSRSSPKVRLTHPRAAPSCSTHQAMANQPRRLVARGKRPAMGSVGDGIEDGGRAQPTKRRAMRPAVIRMMAGTM